MNILLTIDDNFVPQLAANICSICENNCNEEAISFYIFDNGISENNKADLVTFVGTYGRIISFIPITGFMNNLGFEFDTSGWNEIVLSRLLLAKFLPESVNKILYLDGDTIVRGNLKALWETNLESHTLGAVMEPTANKVRRQQLGIGNRPYYNAGVLLVNLTNWRESKAEQRILDYCKTNSDKLFANDQDAINVVLRNEILPLSPSYNFSNVFTYYPFKTLKALMPEFCSEHDFFRAKANPCIVHYLGEERPWRKGNTHTYKADYEHYLSMTPWKGSPQEKGWELYFIVWRIFNAATKLVPRVRLAIINSLIPFFISRKAKKRK